VGAACSRDLRRAGRIALLEWVTMALAPTLQQQGLVLNPFVFFVLFVVQLPNLG